MIKKSLSVLLVLGLVVSSAGSVFSLQLLDRNRNVVGDLRPLARKDQTSPWQDAPFDDAGRALVNCDKLIVIPIFGNVVLKYHSGHSGKRRSPTESPLSNRVKSE